MTTKIERFQTPWSKWAPQDIPMNYSLMTANLTLPAANGGQTKSGGCFMHWEKKTARRKLVCEHQTVSSDLFVFVFVGGHTLHEYIFYIL